MKLQFLSSTRFNTLTSPALRPSAEAMAASLRNLGAQITPEIEAAVAGDAKRLNALHQLDFSGEKTAFQHIEDVARAGTLHDGKPAAPLAAALFELAGGAKASSYEVSKCYARVSQATFTLHHAGEFNRIVGKLAAAGSVTLADNTTLNWNPTTLPIVKEHILDLWGAVNHVAKSKTLPPTVELAKSFQTYANKGEMANIMTRLTGEQFVNAQGPEALTHLNDFIDAYGPLPAEFSNHGGAIASIDPPKPGTTRPVLMALEDGGTLYDRSGSVGYAVVPAKEAAERGLPEVAYPDTEAAGYFRLGNG